MNAKKSRDTYIQNILTVREYHNKIAALATWPSSCVCMCVFVFFQKQRDTDDTCHKALPTEKMQAQLISSAW